MIDVVAWRQAFFVDDGQACPETTRVIQVGLKELIATDAAVEWNVLTGVTRCEHLANAPVQPEYVFENIAGVTSLL